MDLPLKQQKYNVTLPALVAVARRQKTAVELKPSISTDPSKTL
jgi:hypothetical protein